MTDLKANIEQLTHLLRIVTLEVIAKLDKIERLPKENVTATVPPKPEIKTSPTELLWSAIKASKSLGISDKTLWTFTQRGEIPCIRIGKRVLYDPADLRAWIESKKAKRDNKT